MNTHTLTGWIANTTDKAMAFVEDPTMGENSPMWIPRKKIAVQFEGDATSRPIMLKGEKISRSAIPVTIEVDIEFLKRIKRLPAQVVNFLFANVLKTDYNKGKKMNRIRDQP